MKYRYLISLEVGAAVVVLATLSEAFFAPAPALPRGCGKQHYSSHSCVTKNPISESRKNHSPEREVVTVLFADNNNNQEPDVDDVENTATSSSSSDDSGDSTADYDAVVMDLTTEVVEEDVESSTKDDHKSTFEKSLEESVRFDSSVVDVKKSMSQETTIQLALQRLLQLAASTGRGEFATPVQKREAADLIVTIESSNGIPEPTKSPLITGRWQLLYSSTQLFRSSPFFMAGRAVCTTSDQAKQYDWFCDMHRKALAMSTIGQVRQIISTNTIVSEFEVQAGAIPFLNDFTPFSYSGGLPVSIDGAIVSSADLTPTADGTAWDLYMDTVQIKGSNVPGLRQILDGGIRLGSRQLGSLLEQNVNSYTNPKPVFKTTYLSETIRISKDQDGKVFVYGKESDDTAPTDYSTIESDLGLLKLLEGFNDAVTKFYI